MVSGEQAVSCCQHLRAFNIRHPGELVCKPSGVQCEMQQAFIWLRGPYLWHVRLAIVEKADLWAYVQISPDAGKEQVLRQLARIIDPDFGQDIVSCGFVKELTADPKSGQVTFALELTTPACPIKDEFERKARDYVAELHWVQQVRGLAILMQLCVGEKSLCEPLQTALAIQHLHAHIPAL